MFKIGDWVRTNGDGIFKIVNNYTLCKDHEIWELYIKRDIEKVELWVPKECEYCWFTLDDGSKPIFGKFSGYTEENYPTWDNRKYYSDKCEPFIGELPTIYQKEENV